MLLRSVLILSLMMSSTLDAAAPSSSPADPATDLRLQIAPQTLRSSEVTLIWDKLAGVGREREYQVFAGDRLIGATKRTYFTVRDLAPSTAYAFEVHGPTAADRSIVSRALRVETPAKEPTLSIEAFGAKGDGTTLNTKAIQAAIDACPPHGVVLIPKGVFVSGALFLKSDMTLAIAAGGVLKGSTSPADYEPFVRNRFEGWEMSTYASLLNAGVLDHAGAPNVRHLSICGEGTISGGGGVLAKAMIAAHGMRSRGRLICLLNCAEVEIQGLTLEDSPCWTLHYVYCTDVTCHDLTINSHVTNGDGLDPDSSSRSYIFNCSFSTGDDCIAIKSGKNPEGNVIARPTEHVRIFDCRFTRGHGISIGSEISGGVRDVRVEDCVAGNLLNGLQIKATKDRGAFVEDVTVRDCDLQKITVLTALEYNNDGQPAPTEPYFRNFRFTNIDLSQGKPNSPIVVIDGFPAEDHRTRQVTLENARLPSGAVVQVDRAEDVVFSHVQTADGKSPRYEISRSERVSY